MTPPTPWIFGQSREDTIPWSSYGHVKRNVHGRLLGVHRLCAPRNLPAKAKQPGSPAGGMQVDPTLIHPLQWNGVEVMPSLATTLPTCDEARSRENLEVAHDRDARDLEVGCDIAGDSWSLVQQVEDLAPGRIRQGEPNRAAIGVELSFHTACSTVGTRNSSITY